MLLLLDWGSAVAFALNWTQTEVDCAGGGYLSAQLAFARTSGQQHSERNLVAQDSAFGNGFDGQEQISGPQCGT